MRIFVYSFLAVVAVGGATHALIPLATLHQALVQEKRTLTRADIDRWMSELSNWGRWGKEDQLGAVNLITEAKRKQAAALVREGFSVSLARDTEKERAEDNQSPYEHTMTMSGVNNRGQFSIDAFRVSFHGYQHTHLDALCH